MILNSEPTHLALSRADELVAAIPEAAVPHAAAVQQPRDIDEAALRVVAERNEDATVAVRVVHRHSERRLGAHVDTVQASTHWKRRNQAFEKCPSEEISSKT